MHNRTQNNHLLALLLAVCLGCFCFYNAALAAKGDTKEKKGVVLKFNGFELKTVNAQSLILKPGFTYKGSFSNILKSPSETTIQSIITYQRGNTTFIYPYQHKVTVPRFKTPQPQKF